MRIRKKKWARPELAACPFYVHEPKTAAGTWGERFKKQQPIHLDLGCGKCTFLAKLAHREKDVNFIGIDISEDILNTYKKVLAPGGELWFKTDNTDLYLATQRYLAETGFEILCKTDDLHSEDAPGNIQSEHEVMFTAEGIKTKAIIARWNGEPETPEKVSTEQAEKVENTDE